MIRTALGFAVACATIGPITYMAADRETPYVRISGKAVPSIVAPEEEVSFEWQLFVRRERQCKAVGAVHIRFIDSTGAVKDLEPQPALTRQYDEKFVMRRRLKVPAGLSEGRARYHSESCFACNILQEFTRPVCVSEPDIFFEIRRKD